MPACAVKLAVTGDSFCNLTISLDNQDGREEGEPVLVVGKLQSFAICAWPEQVCQPHLWCRSLLVS